MHTCTCMFFIHVHVHVCVHEKSSVCIPKGRRCKPWTAVSACEYIIITSTHVHVCSYGQNLVNNLQLRSTENTGTCITYICIHVHVCDEGQKPETAGFAPSSFLLALCT